MPLTDKTLIENSAEVIQDKNWYSEKEIKEIKNEAFKAGAKHNKAQFDKQFAANISKAQNISVVIFITLSKTLKVAVKGIRLKPTFFNSFEAIFIIPSKDFLSPDRYKLIHKVATEAMQQYLTKDLSFTILFMPYSKKINEEAFESEGFYFTFRKKD